MVHLCLDAYCNALFIPTIVGCDGTQDQQVGGTRWERPLPLSAIVRYWLTQKSETVGRPISLVLRGNLLHSTIGSQPWHSPSLLWLLLPISTRFHNLLPPFWLQWNPGSTRRWHTVGVSLAHFSYCSVLEYPEK